MVPSSIKLPAFVLLPEMLNDGPLRAHSTVVGALASVTPGSVSMSPRAFLPFNGRLSRRALSTVSPIVGSAVSMLTAYRRP